MRRRVVAVALLAVVAWSGMIAGASTGIALLIVLDRVEQVMAAPGGALLICESIATAPRR